MEIKKIIDIPQSLLDLSPDDLEDLEFADSTNRLFPLNNKANIEESMNLFKEFIDLYSKAEQIYILGQIIEEAKKYDISINNLNIKEVKGGMPEMNELKIDVRETPEFKKALAEELDKNKMHKEKEELSEQIKNIQKTVEDLKSKADKLEEEKVALEVEKQELSSKYENEKKTEKRFEDLTKAGIRFKEVEIKDYLKELNDDGFELFKTILTDAIASSKEEKKVDDPNNPKGDKADASKKEEILPNQPEPTKADVKKDKLEIVDTIIKI